MSDQTFQEKLTFIQYLESKEKLREAVLKTPKRTAIYEMRKYCKLVVGETKEEKQLIALKPTQKITVNFLYENIDNPTIINISFDGVKGVDAEEEYETFWDGAKLLKWLARNAREENV